MAEEVLEINSYETDDIKSGLNELNKDITTVNDELSKDFASYKHSEILGKSMNKLNNQLEDIASSIMIMSNSVQKGTDSMFELEYKLSEEVKAIDIPKGFETTDI